MCKEEFRALSSSAKIRFAQQPPPTKGSFIERDNVNSSISKERTERRLLPLVQLGEGGGTSLPLTFSLTLFVNAALKMQEHNNASTQVFIPSML